MGKAKKKTKLKGCPFCGSKPEAKHSDLYAAFLIRCVNLQCFVSVMAKGEDFEAAACIWNHRSKNNH